jgi:hypothetical protein
VGRDRVNGKGERSRVWLMYFLFLHENRTMKPAETLVVIWSRRRMMKRVNLTQVHYIVNIYGTVTVNTSCTTNMC